MYFFLLKLIRRNAAQAPDNGPEDVNDDHNVVVVGKIADRFQKVEKKLTHPTN